MHPVIIVIGIGWVIFWIAWLIAAFTAKASRGRWNRLAGSRIVLAIVVVILFRANLRGGSERIDGPVLAGIGLVLWIAGLALAVWARLYIGRNWGMPMTRREEPELVTTGPYRFIRHPIYTGIILAMIGTALAISLFGLIVVAVVAAFFAYSASREERFLAEEFPATFPDYKVRTKLLIPFVFLPWRTRRTSRRTGRPLPRRPARVPLRVPPRTQRAASGPVCAVRRLSRERSLGTCACW